MVKKSRGFRHDTRNKLRQDPSHRPTITKFLKKFKKDDQVMIYPEPSSHKGMPFPRYMGKVGKVVGTRGRSYIVEVPFGRIKKTIISRVEHLKKM